MKPVQILPLILLALVSACSTTDEQKPAATLSAPSAASAATAAPAPTTGPVANAPLTGTAQSPINAAMVAGPARHSVYFGFDEYNVNPQFINVIEDHARYLRANPSVKARVEGNSDERGSREYNLALGQRRAEAVMKVLNLHGVPADRVEVISLGEEKPSRTGHDDASWAENRRSDVMLKGGK
ncbi:MAG: peptidoglycan-associated lipoprotein Pal [Burkholderiales bacterium]